LSHADSADKVHWPRTPQNFGASRLWNAFVKDFPDAAMLCDVSAASHAGIAKRVITSPDFGCPCRAGLTG
jgi:uncharacterized protein (DUF1800 family)